MELRHILIVLAVVALAAILFDGWRRLRARSAAQAAPSAPARTPAAAPRRAAEDDFNPELPSGGARVVRRERTAPALGNVGSVAQAPATPVAPAVPAPPPEPPRKIEQVDMFGDVEIPAAQPAPAREIRDSGQMPRRQPPASPAGERPSRAAAAEKKPKRPTPEEVIVVHVMSGSERLPGNRLMQAVLDCGMRWGEYHIFHRYENGAHDALAVFSMANAVEPGVFDIDTMENQSFVGVSFFLMLPGPANSRQALDMMVEAARRVARDTGGELRDEQHSVLTQQTIEHLRQRVMEFERRKLAQQRANG